MAPSQKSDLGGRGSTDASGLQALDVSFSPRSPSPPTPLLTPVGAGGAGFCQSEASSELRQDVTPTERRVSNTSGSHQVNATIEVGGGARGDQRARSQPEQPSLRGLSCGSGGSTTVPPSSMAAAAVAAMAHATAQSCDPYEGLHLTPINDKPFKAISSIARQAQKNLIERLATR